MVALVQQGATAASIVASVQQAQMVTELGELGNIRNAIVLGTSTVSGHIQNLTAVLESKEFSPEITVSQTGISRDIDDGGLRDLL